MFPKLIDSDDRRHVTGSATHTLELGQGVTMAMQTQLGDAARLNEHKRRCLQFLADIQQHVNIFPPTEWQTITESMQCMVHALEGGVSASLDQPDASTASPIQRGGTVPTTIAGHPPINIHPDHLALLAAGRTTHQEIADLHQCNARTIRRRLVEYGLSSPGPPVYVNEPQEDGTTRRVYSAGRSSDISRMTDEQLDTVMVTIYDSERFPSFGRRMVDGYLMALGERVPHRRIIESFQRVIEPPVTTFGNRRIERRVYSVPGPNSLWHHDGQHGRAERKKRLGCQ